MTKLRYFKPGADAPLPLTASVKRVVRFEEVDSLGIVWHGRYPSYLEDARVSLGDKYQIGYKDFYRHKVLAPIKRMHLDYFLPLRFQDQFVVQASLVWAESARINHEFRIHDYRERLIATGYSVQMFVDQDGQFLLEAPYFYAQFLNDWRQGRI